MASRHQFDALAAVAQRLTSLHPAAGDADQAVFEQVLSAIVDHFARQLSKDVVCARRLEAARAAQQPQQGGAASTAAFGFMRLLDGYDFGVAQDDAQWPSACGRQAPRLRSKLDNQLRLAKRIANAVFPLAVLAQHLRDASAAPLSEDATAVKAKLLSYRFYKKCVSLLAGYNKELAPNHASNTHRKLIEARGDPERWEELQDLPLSEYITYPRPEPVLPCSLAELQPLLQYLQHDGPVHEQTAFTKGTMTTDGRLDLCKQVVGPQGIQPLLDAMMATSRVKRLLLGNNVVGDGGAEAIARFIEEREDSPLTCWYIAGNEIGPLGFERVCQALKHDTRVDSLWMKRNPLSPAGMLPLRDLLRVNRTITVIDLVNCGLLDEGLSNLLPALMGPDRNRTLQHLYLGTNGITDQSAPLIAEFIERDCQLESFYLSLNRLGDKGAAVIAPALSRNRALRRVSFASNRIGSEGAAALCQALHHHPSIELLDLGYTKATTAVRELGNHIGDEGALHVSNLLKNNTKIVALDLLHNSISQVGVNHIIDGLRANHSLALLQLTQFGKVHNEPGKEEIKALLARNYQALSDDEKKHLDLVEIPQHISEIYSVYRTHV